MIYLDFAATTPIASEVFEAMLPYLKPDGLHGNPASTHGPGFAARAAVEQARAQVAALIGAEPAEIIWTSGATESNNLAIKGALEFRGFPKAGRAVHIVTSRTEHKCVLDTCRHLETLGARVTYLKPDEHGVVTPEAVLAAITPDTALVSLMWVNNEIGAVNDIERLAPLLRARGVMLHVDAAQAAGKLAIDLRTLPVDLLSLSAHKLYGPKGVGALYVRRKPRARLSPQMHGGGHEQGMRSGTLATHQVVGFGAACTLAAERFDADIAHFSALRDALWTRLQSIPGVLRNGPTEGERAAPHLLNLSFPGVEGEALRASLPGIAVSSGSACSSATAEPSYVLRALGRDDETANASLRFSFGRMTTPADIEQAADTVIAQVARLRALSPFGSEAPIANPPEEAAGNPYGYGPEIWRLFRKTPNAGRFLESAPDVIRAEAGTPAARSVLRLALRLDGDRVAEARFLAYGCPTTIAVGAYVAGWAQGKAMAELVALTAPALRSVLEIPEDRAHCALLGEDALRAVFARHKEEMA
ncbi:aminotransferase class V-fold PLP-dependent enzyme [Nevskia sp.]|uniref:aminotransferase class V-fold PLP-dependent enzyme n=1 Tax=Nevskia sp. TaxID=1929292 RepID=UPI0025DFE113|nr:aminotransferase class V-fold PLP-dependent enzyme [Nevskia sp.]